MITQAQYGMTRCSAQDTFAPTKALNENSTSIICSPGGSIGCARVASAREVVAR